MLQLISVVAFVMLLASLSYPPGRENWLLQWASRLDPWLLLSQLRWQQAVPAWVWLPLLTVTATLLWGRVFCGWLCPLGAMLMWTDKIGKAAFKNMSPVRVQILRTVQPIRYYWLLVLLIVFALGSNWVIFLTPFALFSHELARVLQGYMPWLLIGIMAGTLLFSRLWCSVLCPTGVLLSLAARLRLFGYRIAGNCVYCEQCASACSVGAASVDTAVAQAGCLACGDCHRVCPAKAISWQHRWPSGKDSRLVPADGGAAAKRQGSRRQFLKAAGAVALAAAFWEKTVGAAEPVLRPPGSLPAPDFTAVCNRCGRCIQVCPGKALQPMPITDGLTNFATPYIIPRQSRCDLCLSCQEVCPTGAIVQVPLDKVRMGRAILDKSRCIAWEENKLCFICGEQCPVLAITGDEYHRPTILLDKCAGCGSCENACPVAGEAAIRVLPQ
ncbi:Electron transport complex subunit RsxB [Sporomusa termitida]|uniref:Electron transport complex subunit RsxB n=2 Tax=Sporomusa termitida TaxID=2377 RepID=A0A517DYE9_9FIRM|nr:Electron transport complex subunit RsxB [Sporomusa termitida]